MEDRKQRLISLLNTPPAERKGTSGYLVDKWHFLHDARTKLETIVNRKEAELNEARTQYTKAAGAVEAIEAMLLEFDTKAANPDQLTQSLPPPRESHLPQPPPEETTDPVVEEARRRALEKVKGARAAAAAAGVPTLLKTAPEEGAKKGEPS